MIGLTPLPVHFTDIWANYIRGPTAAVKILFQHDRILIPDCNLFYHPG